MIRRQKQNGYWGVSNFLRDEQFPLSALLKCFFAESENHFGFLERRYGFTPISGMIEYFKNYKIIKPFREQDIESSFSAVARYEKNNQALELTYGDDQFSIQGYAYFNPVDRYEFSEIMDAARKQFQTHDDWGLTNPDMIAATTQELAKTVSSNARIFLDPSPRLLERIQTIRDTRLEHAIRQRHSDTLKIVGLEAARAYREKDYRRVIELLEPHRHYLKKAELKKLDRAKTAVLSMK